MQGMKTKGIYVCRLDMKESILQLRKGQLFVRAD
jgi:hypothetical protein